MTGEALLLERVLKQDRLVVLGGLVLVVLLAWAYVFYLAQNMTQGMSAAMPHMMRWGLVDWGSMFLMWSVMMVAMMVPSAAPMVLIFSTVNRRRQQQELPYVATGVFLLGYLLIWTVFSAIATVGNWALHTHALLSGMMGGSTTAMLGGSLLLAAGIFQWTPLKYACLSHCRSPLGFIMTEWREGQIGALRMGLKHGTYCLLCCWLLMALLFVMGIMNLVWIAALAGFVLLEKASPKGTWISRVSGLGLVAWGVFLLTGVIR